MNIMITGASRGIGYQLVLQLLKGNNRVIAISRNTNALQNLMTEAKQQQLGEQLTIMGCDLMKLPKVQIKETIQEIGGLDVIIHNAGLLINKSFLELTREDWHTIYQVNVFGVVELTQLALPYLKASTNPHVVTIGSMGGFQGSSKFPGLAAYSSSKAALSNLTECLAEEFKDLGIAVNCLALGAVQTEMLAEAFPGYKPPMTAKEMANFIAYFATNGQQFFNGKILPVSSSTP